MITSDYSIYLEKKEKFIKQYQGKFGCILEFHGFVREYDLKDKQKIPAKGLNIKKIILEKLESIKEKTIKKYDLIEIIIYHNTGFLEVGEKVTSIAIFAKHRYEAFNALSFIINEIKKYH